MSYLACLPACAFSHESAIVMFEDTVQSADAGVIDDNAHGAPAVLCPTTTVVD